MVLYALEQNGIVPAEVTYLAGADKTKDLLVSDADAVVVTAEPALTAATFAVKKEEKTIKELCLGQGSFNALMGRTPTIGMISTGSVIIFMERLLKNCA